MCPYFLSPLPLYRFDFFFFLARASSLDSTSRLFLSSPHFLKYNSDVPPCLRASSHTPSATENCFYRIPSCILSLFPSALHQLWVCLIFPSLMLCLGRQNPLTPPFWVPASCACLPALLLSPPWDVLLSRQWYLSLKGGLFSEMLLRCRHIGPENKAQFPPTYW